MRHLLLLVALTLVGCFAPERPPSTGRLERFPLTGAKVDETWQLFVRLPPEYDAEPERRFPLVVQLDANLPTFEEFAVTAGFASRLETAGQTRPCVVVGIGYGTGQEAQLERQRDLALPLENEAFRARWGTLEPAPNAPAFYDFLRDELVPHLERTYRLDGQRALFGHSLGGLFTLYALTRHDDAAPLFTGFVAASPSIFWDGGQLLERWKTLRAPTTPLVLFAAAGQLEGPEMIGFFDELAERTRAAPLAGLSTEFRTWQVDHVGAVAPSFREGLLHLAAHGFGGAP